MERRLHDFVLLLRLFGMRVSAPEAVDAMRAAAQPGMLADPGTLREALRVCLVKDRRDDEVFGEVFDTFFALRPVTPPVDDHGHSHAHDDLSDTGQVYGLTLSEEPSQTTEQGHSHGKPVDIREFFDPQLLAQRYNLHQEANKIDLAAATRDIVLSREATSGQPDGLRVKLATERLHSAGAPGRLADAGGHRIGTQLTVVQEHALLGWLTDGHDDDEGLPPAGRERLAGILADLPELLGRFLDRLAELQRVAIESADSATHRVDRIGERERQQLEEALRRLTSGIGGALTSRHRTSSRGRVQAARTMRHNMRYDAVPFRPVAVSRTEDRPRLLVLADVSLSVRATARFTLHLVHGLQSLVRRVRSFAFVAEPAEITELFEEHPVERALGLVFDGLAAGGILDVDACSDYGNTFARLLAEHGTAFSRRTTVLVLGDGRGNGNDPGVEAFAEIARRSRRVLWLTPEPRYSWRLGSCDLPRYAEHCHQVHVVRDLSGLDRMTAEAAPEPRW